MYKHLTPEDRLEVLRAADGLRKWQSLDDERICVVCDRTFTGRQVEITRDQRGRYLLQCPTESCPSILAHWFYGDHAAIAAADVLRDDEKKGKAKPSLDHSGFPTQAVA